MFQKEGPRLPPGAQDLCVHSELTKSDIDQFLQTGLADFSLRELWGLLISTAGAAERSVYLEKEPTDKPNSFYDRSLQLGTIPVAGRVPRTRTAEFRRAPLPLRYPLV